MSDAALITLLQIISLIGSLLTVFKLFQTGLYKRYPWFFGYFLFRIPNTLWPLLFQMNGVVYYYFWLATEPLTWIFHAAVLLELYRLVLEKHKGLYTLGRWAVFVGTSASILISIAGLIPRLAAASDPRVSRTMLWYLALERGWMLGLAVFVLFMIGFLVLYTVPISRNIRTHARIYTVFFICNYLAYLLIAALPHSFLPKLNLFANALSVGCVFAWFFILSPKGERIQIVTPVIGEEQERRVLRQLDALNATMLKMARN